MKRTILWMILVITAIAVAAILIFLGLSDYSYACCGAALLGIILLYRSTALPMRTIRNGMDLLRSQDFASRLRHVGQKEADEMVDLYNALITNIKSEHLKNLEQENFLSKLIEASPMGIAICNFDGIIERTNPAFRTLSSPLLLEELASLQDDSQSTFRAEGTQILRCSRLFFMDRGFRRPFFLVERLTDEIIKAETSVFNKIVRTISHEVNNTLGGVISILETLSALHADDSEITSAIESCRHSCFKLGDFVKGYSDIVKLPEPAFETISLNAFITNSYPFLCKISPDNITIETELCENEVKIAADEMLLQRVLVNAVKNAVESIGDSPGRIVIRTAPKLLEIIDNGPGIAPADASRVFTPFFSTKRADRGLGLMLISDILRKHNALFSLATTPDNLTRLTIRFK